jgi:toxin ParE1/3/4
MTSLPQKSKNGKPYVPEYKLSKRAEQDLTVIWNFSVDRWGETQADDYLKTLHAAIQLLVENPQMGKSRDAIRTGYRSFHQGRHLIFYRPYDDGIRVIRILHQSMEVESHFP